MNNISTYIVKLHNATQYRNFSHATAQYSTVISQKLAEISEQDLKHAEIFFENGQNQPLQSIYLNSFDINLDCEASDYTPNILQTIITEEKFLAEVYKKNDLKNLHLVSLYRASDLEELLEHLKDGSLFGHTVNTGLSSQNRRDCICTACGYVHRHTQNGPQYFPDECPLCGAGQGLFIRRRPAGGW